MSSKLRIAVDNYLFVQRMRRISTRTREATNWVLKRVPLDRDLPMFLKRQVY
jgi:hypothetical protein